MKLTFVAVAAAPRLKYSCQQKLRAFALRRRHRETRLTPGMSCRPKWRALYSSFRKGRETLDPSAPSLCQASLTFPNHQFQRRPRIVDRADLDVNQRQRQRELAHNILCHVR